MHFHSREVFGEALAGFRVDGDNPGGTEGVNQTGQIVDVGETGGVVVDQQNVGRG